MVKSKTAIFISSYALFILIKTAMDFSIVASLRYYLALKQVSLSRNHGPSYADGVYSNNSKEIRKYRVFV